MAVNGSRLRSAGLAKESILGTPITTPTRYLNIVPPDSFTPMIEPLPSKGIEVLRDMYPKITQGPGTLNGMKVKLELEPENCGEIFQALFGLDTKTGANPYTHTYQPQQVSVLPSYTWWFDKKPKYQLIAGACCSKADIDIKAKGIVELDTDWVGTVYDDTDGIAESSSFSALNPFVWSNAVVSVDSGTVSGYDNVKISIDNKIKADHALNNSIWPYVIYTEGCDIQVSAELFFENTTQYQKFLAGTTAHLSVVLTSPQIITGISHYTLTLDIPSWYYKSANIYIPSSGPLKIPFTGMAQYNTGSGYSIQFALVNGVSTQY